MKRNQNVKRVQLKINHEGEFFLLGLVSSDPDYKLTLAINRKLGINLKHLDPILITSETGAELTFSRFSDAGEENRMTCNLFSNRSGNSFLLKKLKNIDFIFLVSEPENKDIAENLSFKLREIESLNGIFNINPENIKDKNLQHLIL
jgi:hypothetical protein